MDLVLSQATSFSFADVSSFCGEISFVLLVPVSFVACDSSLFRTHRFLAVPMFAVVFRLLRVVVVIVVVVVAVVVAAVTDVASLGPVVFLHFLQMKSSSAFT